MKNSEKNLIIPDDRREPGDVYMILSPEGKVKVISTVDLIYKRFTDFVNDGAFYALRDHKPPYTNDFFRAIPLPCSEDDSVVGCRCGHGQVFQ